MGEIINDISADAPLLDKIGINSSHIIMGGRQFERFPFRKRQTIRHTTFLVQRIALVWNNIRVILHSKKQLDSFRVGQSILLLHKIHRIAATLLIVIIKLVAAQSDMMADPFVLTSGAFYFLSAALQKSGQIGLLGRLSLRFSEGNVFCSHA